MNNYIFGWQEKSSLLTIEANQIAQTNGISDIFRVDFRDIFAFFIENQAYFYFSKSDTIKWKEEGKKYLQDGYLEMLLGRTKQLQSRFKMFVKNIESLSIIDMNNEKIFELFSQYFELVVNIAGIYHASQPEGLFYVDKAIKKLLNTTLSKKESEDVFVTLSTPQELDLVQKEKIEWLELIKQKDIIDDQYLKHAKKYSAYFFNTYSYNAAINYLRRKHDQSSITEVNREVKEIYSRQIQMKKKWNKLSHELSSELLDFSKVLQKISVDRFELKEGWQGAEFLALNLFIEISRRIGITIEEFFYGYGKEDIEAFLLKGEKLSDAEVRNRKKAIFTKIIDEKRTFISGDEAFNKIQSLLNDNTSTRKTVKGMPVQSGIAIGNVRVLLVEDITSFAKVAKYFKKGEILVTTMTSPNIIALMKDAGGIVTNEGGICSHAAIVSRELGKPCVVGTENATRVFKTGDRVLLDANKGIVSVIRKSMNTNAL